MRKTWYRAVCAGLCAILLGMAFGCVTTDAVGPVPDNQLADAVSIRLDHDPVTAVCNLMVMVQDGVVYLRGKAPTSNMIRARAVSIALGTPGVVEVVDDLYPPTNGVY